MVSTDSHISFDNKTKTKAHTEPQAMASITLGIGVFFHLVAKYQALLKLLIITYEFN